MIKQIKTRELLEKVVTIGSEWVQEDRINVQKAISKKTLSPEKTFFVTLKSKNITYNI